MSEQYRTDPVADPMLSETQPSSFPSAATPGTSASPLSPDWTCWPSR